MSGYSSGGNVSASGTSSSSCSTTYTPPSSQDIDIRKPVIYILAETENSRMVLTCTRNVRWSQCNALNPGQFIARTGKGKLEVQAVFPKGKEEWIKFDVVQQATIRRPEPTPTTLPAPASIEASKPASTDANTQWPKHWKSMQSGSVRTLRFEGDYIYAEQVLPEDAVKAGIFFLWELKKDGDKYVGKVNARILKEPGGPACAATFTAELTHVTKERIEGRTLSPSPNAKLDWETCQYSPPPEWQEFSWIPVE